ncbi:MAG: hypothetical protein CSA22_03350 [Deltaproteobacteria bacterium]|nr:MAG: hypothetical protein CSA22_03350 [Deltaproteobacteria bacterium]
MKIEWEISKKQGNLRPRLHYRVTLDPFETKLGMAMVRVESGIPKPPDAWESVVYPDTRERSVDWIPTVFYELKTPSHKTGVHEDGMTLPFRENGEYPEVEAAFLDLRAAFEKELSKTCDCRGFQSKGALELTPEARRRIAPGIAAAQMLRAIGA